MVANPPDPAPVAGRYGALVAAGAIEDDPAQRALVARLDRLAAALMERRLATKSSALGWMFGRRAAEPLRGLYIHGGVGRGKSMLMDLFHAAVPMRRKRRAHFHAFMADIHGRVHAHRRAVAAGHVRDPDPVPAVATAIAEEARLLCFDEFSVTDIADAMILGRLFERLFAAGVVLVATSNVAPDDLYRDGLNRGHFLPFIALLKRHADPVELVARTDFRLEKLSAAPVYLTPLGPDTDAAIDVAFRRLAGGAGAPEALAVDGRRLEVPEARQGVARFSFAELCGRPLGSRDYLALVRAYHTLVLERIPVLDPERRNEAKRLINLVDIVYDHRAKLICSAAAPPDGLHAGGGTEAFEFRRTASRLHEMGAPDYLAAARRPAEAAPTEG